jgi:large subunit ribosomal protein L30
MANTLNVTLVKSVIGRIEAHKATVKGLGLRRIRHTVTLEDTPAVRGMINAVSYLVQVTEGAPVAAKEKPAKAAKAKSSKVVAEQESAASALPKKYLTKTGADDLTAIEGVGPKISELLHAAGITQLAEANVADIEAVLKAAGSRYAMANPGTWPEQSALLAAGKHEEFETLAAELDGGVRK